MDLLEISKPLSARAGIDSRSALLRNRDSKHPDVVQVSQG